MFSNRCCSNRQFGMGFGMNQNSCCSEQPVVEPTITKCVEQEFYHEVPHVCPIHTHTINIFINILIHHNILAQKKNKYAI